MFRKAGALGASLLAGKRPLKDESEMRDDEGQTVIEGRALQRELAELRVDAEKLRKELVEKDQKKAEKDTTSGSPRA